MLQCATSKRDRKHEKAKCVRCVNDGLGQKSEWLWRMKHLVVTQCLCDCMQCGDTEVVRDAINRDSATGSAQLCGSGAV